jgi:hypothetical protein
MFSGLRYILTKRFVRRENLSDSEEFILLHLAEEVLNTKDLSFQTSNAEALSALSCLVKLSNLKYLKTAQHMVEVVKLLQKNSKLFFSPRAYLGFNFNPKNFVVKTNRALRRRPKPERYIGVGYKDSGHQGNSAIDGSPPWKEVIAAKGLTSSHGITRIRYQRTVGEFSNVPTTKILASPDYLKSFN